MPNNLTANLTYGRLYRDRRTIRAIHLIAGGLFVQLLAGLWTGQKQTYVNYSSGLIRQRLYAMGVPVYTSDWPICDTNGIAFGTGGWRLMVSQHMLVPGVNKVERIDAGIVSELRTTLMMMTLAGDTITEKRRSDLTKAAWMAASVGDVDAMKAIQREVEGR